MANVDAVTPKKGTRDRAKSLPAIRHAEIEGMKKLPNLQTSLQRNVSEKTKKVYLQSTRKLDRVHEVQPDNFRIKYLQSVNVIKKTPVTDRLAENKEEITIPIANQIPRENFDFHSSGGSPKNNTMLNFYDEKRLRPSSYNSNNSFRVDEPPMNNPPSDSEQCIFDLD